MIPDLGARKLRDLSAGEVDRWLAIKAKELSTRSLREVRSILRRSVSRAQARDMVKRNVVLLCELPKGPEGRRSKSLTMNQAAVVLTAAEGSPLHAYVVLSLLMGARTEELRALTWDYVDLIGEPDADPQVPPSIMVGDRSDPVGIPRPRSHVERSPCREDVSTPYGLSSSSRPSIGNKPVRRGRKQVWSSYPRLALSSMPRAFVAASTT